MEKLGKQTIKFNNPPSVLSTACIVGPKESEGPLAKYFDHICGATLDGSRSKKADIITYLLEKTGGAENAVMVGDTSYDVIGAKAHGMPAIGVSWGYGKVADMEAEGAAAIAYTMDQLLHLLDE